MAESLGRSPTFVVGSDRQRGTLDALVRREQHFSEQYQKNKPLCFNAKAFQRTHPRKAQQGHKDADATLVSPMLVGLCDGVSQIEEFGIDASELPHEILNAVEELAISQLLPDHSGTSKDAYRGPIAMLREAYESTECLGSTTVLLGIMDNSTKIHGKLHPMIAVLSVGDCEILIMRRQEGQLKTVFHTEMQRIDGHAQAPLQVARVDEQVDPDFDERIAIEVIERGSAVHCVSAFEGDIVVLGSDGVFDNLFVDEIVSICDDMLRPPSQGKKFAPTDRALLGQVARRIVKESHAKTQPGLGGFYADAPIGRGGKVDDTSCIVGEVVEWTHAHSEAWTRLRKQKQWHSLLTCGGHLPTCDEDHSDGDLEGYTDSAQVQSYPGNPSGSFSTYKGSFSEYGSFASLGSFTNLSKRVGSSFTTYQGSFSEYGNNSFASVGQQPRSRRGGRRRGRDDEEEDDDGAGCSVS